MSFTYHRTIHFADTDAAGVVYFANYLSICHEAYEEALDANGIVLKDFFADTGVVIPVSKSEAQYFRPLLCGDKVRIAVRPETLSENSYAIVYEVSKGGRLEKLVAKARTEHVCIDSKTRERKTIPPQLVAWIAKG